MVATSEIPAAMDQLAASMNWFVGRLLALLPPSEHPEFQARCAAMTESIHVLIQVLEDYAAVLLALDAQRSA